MWYFFPSQNASKCVYSLDRFANLARKKLLACSRLNFRGWGRIDAAACVDWGQRKSHASFSFAPHFFVISFTVQQQSSEGTQTNGRKCVLWAQTRERKNAVLAHFAYEIANYFGSRFIWAIHYATTLSHYTPPPLLHVANLVENK